MKIAHCVTTQKSEVPPDKLILWTALCLCCDQAVLFFFSHFLSVRIGPTNLSTSLFILRFRFLLLIITELLENKDQLTFLLLSKEKLENFK